MKSRDILAVFNRGRISRLALARTDVARVALSAEIQKNFMPRTLGSMMLRPGLEYVGFGGASDGGAYVPFIFSTADNAVLDLVPGLMRVWTNGETLLTRPAVTTTIANGTFNSNLTSWTDADDVGATSVWVTGGYMGLLGGVGVTARRQQLVTVAGANIGVKHALRIVINRGPVLLRIGTTAGDDNVFRQAVLRTGTHSIAFTPSVDFHIEFSSPLTYQVLVDSVALEAAGTVEIPTDWSSVALCKKVRWSQSGDVVFCACAERKPQRIERRPNDSWSVVDFLSNDGPYLTENTEDITVTPSGLSGSVTLTASHNLFKSQQVGALFRITSQGQRVSANLSAANTFTDPIRVVGVVDSRIFTLAISGTWAGTISLQRSLVEPGSWETVQTYTGNVAATAYDDGLDNAIVYYRLGFEAGNYTSGTATCSLTFSLGSITGVARITGWTSSTVVDAVVLTNFGGTTASDIWSEGAWSDFQGFPSAVAISEGRLWWSGIGRNWASVPDGFTSFDPEVIGDSQPIDRRVGDGAVNSTNWLLPLQQLITGTDGGEFSIRSTSFEEPVTPSNYNAKARSTKGSAAVPAVLADARGYFVGRTENQVFELDYDSGTFGYVARDTMLLVPEIGEPSIIRLGVQQSPDMRLHAVRSDGTAAILVRDAAEDVMCWVDFETNGIVEDVVVLPGTVEDKVYYRVRRVVEGVFKRYHERWALEREARGGTDNKMADSFVTGTGPVTGLDHLEGKTVVIWGDGADQGTAVVVSGAVAGSYTDWCVGLGYSGQYKSAKLAGQTGLGLSLTQRSRINKIGLVLADTHQQGIQFGPDFDTMDDLPLVEDGTAVTAMWTDYDQDMVEFPGDWSTDNRLCLTATAPRPVTVLGAVLNVDRQDHA